MSAGVVAELGVLFTANTSALESGLAKARAETDKAGKAAESSGGMFGKLAVAAVGIGAGVFAAKELGEAVFSVVGAAEAAGDAKARLDGILGSDLSGVIQDNATIANQLGMTKTAYLEASGAAANYLVNLGLGKDAAADMAMGMTELAPKLAAFANADPSAVTEALQKGVAGSTRGLKDLGIAINDDLLKGLDDAAKSAEIYRQIQEQSGPAAAAWADNQGDVANSMARVSAAMDDAKVAIGDKLLPIIAPLVQWFADKLPGAIDTVMSAFGTLSDIVSPFVSKIGDLVSGFTSAGDWSSSLGETIATLAEEFLGLKDGALAPVADAINAFVTTATAWRDNIVAFFADVNGKGESFRDKLVAVWTMIKDAVGKVVDWFNTNVKPILLAVFETVASKVADLKAQFDQHFGGIRGFVQSVIDWFQSNVAPTLSKVFDDVMAVVGPVVEFLRAHMDQIKAIVGGAIDVVVGVVKIGFNLLKGVFEVIMAAIRGDWGGAWEAIKRTVANIIPGIKQVIGGMFDYLKGLGKLALDAALGIGGSIVDGIRNGISNAWAGFQSWIHDQVMKIPEAVRNLLGIHSPSTVFAAIGANVVEGLRQGMAGMADLAGIINETLGRIIGDADRENFKSIAELTGSLLDIFTNTTKAIKALLDFDVTTSAAQISAQFDALVGTFETALLRMKGLAQYAGRGDSPLDFLNMFDVMNIETVSKGFDATIGLINGLLDIAAKIQTVKIPNAADIEALFEPLSKLGDVAARFIASVGTPEGEDATAYFNQGATTAAALASWAKSIADIVGIKFGAVAKDFEAQMKAAAAASVAAWDAVKGMAMEWGQKGVSDRERLLTGIQAYAAAVGAATGILKATAELDLSKAVLVTAEQLRKVADASVAAVGEIARAADWWIRAGKDVTGPIVDGIKAYADAAAVAVGLLKTAADLDFSKAVAVTTAQLHTAADLTVQALGEVLRVAGAFEGMAAEARTKLVQAVKDYADAAGAAIGLLGGTAGMDFSKAVAVTSGQLHDAANYSLMALGELERVAGAFVSMAAEARTKLVAGIKDFADAAGSAIDLLVKGAGGMNALGEVKRLAGIQPRLIRTILEQLRNVVDIVTDPKNAIKAPTEAQAAAIKALGDVGGVFDGIVKAAQGMNQLGEIKQLRGVQPRMIRTLLEQMAVVVAVVTDPRTALKPITADQAAAIKAIGDSSGVLSSLAGVADGFAKMSGKLTIPTDLAARVTTLVDAMRAVVRSITDAMTGDGAISLTDATTGANLADAVKRIGESMGPIFDAINGALESPFGKIKAKGQRGDTFRQNIADRIKGAIVSAVTALNEALASMPTIDVPDALMTGVERLATVYDKILDILGKLDGIKIDAKALAALAAVPGILAGGLTGLDVQGSGGTITMSGGASGGGITINNTVTPTFMPMPVTMNNSITAPITVGPRVVEAVAVEVINVLDIDIKLKPTGP